MDKINGTKIPFYFLSRALILKLQHEILKFNDIRVSWTSPKTDLVTNSLIPENQSFESFSIVASK